MRKRNNIRPGAWERAGDGARSGRLGLDRAKYRKTGRGACAALHEDRPLGKQKPFKIIEL